MTHFSLHVWLEAAAWMTVLLWIAGAVVSVRGIKRQQPLGPTGNDYLRKSSAPLVSVLVPARNEANRVLNNAVRSMLQQDYGNFEVVVVDDRSTDHTAAILKRFAEENPQLRVIDGAELPAGWLGKPHAMQQAFDASRGEWVLATDADMIFDSSAVRTAVTHALDNNFDAVTLIPHVKCLSFWERVFMPTFGWFMLMAMPIERVNDPRRRESIGIGGFFLIRRASLKAIGEYAAVRCEVAEDLRLAEQLKRSGARLRLEYAPGLVETRMQTNFREIWEGFTKNLFAGAKFSLPSTVAGASAVLLFAVAPMLVALLSLLMIAADAPGRWPQLFVPTLLTWLVQVNLFAFINSRSRIPPIYALAVPLGHLLFVLILLNSAIRIVTGSGVTWKGRQVYERTGVRPPRVRQR